MGCKPVCKLCPNLVISTAVAYDAGTNTLNITIPTNAYLNCQKVCIVIAQAIPATTTINAQVYIFVGTSSFPLVTCNGTPVVASQVRTRTKYSTIVKTNATSGVFKLLGNICCSPTSNLQSLPVTGGE